MPTYIPKRGSRIHHIVVSLLARMGTADCQHMAEEAGMHVSNFQCAMRHLVELGDVELLLGGTGSSPGIYTLTQAGQDYAQQISDGKVVTRASPKLKRKAKVATKSKPPQPPSTRDDAGFVHKVIPPGEWKAPLKTPGPNSAFDTAAFVKAGAAVSPLGADTSPARARSVARAPKPQTGSAVRFGLMSDGSMTLAKGEQLIELSDVEFAQLMGFLTLHRDAVKEQLQ